MISDYDPHVVTGYLRSEFGPPTFVIPVFRNLETGSLAIQVVGELNMIEQFIQSPSTDIVSYAIKNDTYRVGNDALFALQVNADDPFLGNHSELKRRISELLEAGMLPNFPAFAHTLAGLLGDASRKDGLRRLIFQSTPDRFEKSKMFFLENNVIRDGLLETVRPENRAAVSQMRIKIRGDRVSVTLPKDADRKAQEEIGTRITGIVKEYTKLPSINLSFDDLNEQAADFLNMASRIKAGLFEFGDGVLDSSANKDWFNPREAFVVIPEIADLHYARNLSKSQVLRALISNKIRVNLLSQLTSQKIVALEPVSLISAMIFRLWCFADFDLAQNSGDFRLHICHFRVREDRSSWLSEKLLKNGVITKTSGDRIGLNLFPISMLLYFVRRRVFIEEELQSSFVYNNRSYFFPYYFNRQFRADWVRFCTGEFKKLNRKTVDGLCYSIKKSSRTLVDDLFSQKG